MITPSVLRIAAVSVAAVLVSATALARHGDLTADALLAEAERARLEAILGAATDDDFDRLLAAESKSGDRHSVLVVTFVMLDLPWEPRLAPRDGRDRRMRKLRAEKALDDLVGVSEHDGLSARYFRAVVSS